MSWRLVARKDVADARRQYHLHGALLLFVLLFAGVAYLFTGAAGATPRTALPTGLATLGTFLVPLVAVSFAQGSVVEMRTRGDLKLLLGLPFSRRDVVLGTYAGRTALVGGSLLAGLVAALVVGLVRGAPPAVDVLLGVAILLAVLAAVFVGLSVAISASVSTETRSGALAIGAFFLFVFQLWGQLPRIALYLLGGFRFPAQTPTWVEVVTQLNPVRAAWTALAGLVPAANDVYVSVPAAPPLYLSVAFSLLVVAAWLVGPLVLGDARFGRTDL